MVDNRRVVIRQRAGYVPSTRAVGALTPDVKARHRRVESQKRVDSLHGKVGAQRKYPVQ